MVKSVLLKISLNITKCKVGKIRENLTNRAFFNFFKFCLKFLSNSTSIYFLYIIYSILGNEDSMSCNLSMTGFNQNAIDFIMSNEIDDSSFIADIEDFEYVNCSVNNAINLQEERESFIVAFEPSEEDFKFKYNEYDRNGNNWDGY